MKIDATRNTFKPGKNYSRVLMQQGRVQLDADWNEQAAIHTATTRRLGADLIGPHGGPPAGLSNKETTLQGTNFTSPALVPAFAVNVLAANAAQAKADFLLLPGHYYVDGVLCSNATTPSIVTAYPSGTSLRVFTWTTDGISFAIGQYLWLFSSDVAAGLANALLQVTGVDYPNRTLTVSGDIQAFINATGDGDPQRHFVRRAPTYLTQTDMPGAPALKDGPYQVYLDVWERAVTSIEDDAIREVALNGPDTAARAKVVAQVKLTAPNPNGGCHTSYELSELFQPSNRGCLMARARPSRGSADPCTVSPDARYYGPENQLYRVEVHTGSFDAQGNVATPTFKWSRENGAVVFAIASGGDTSLVTLESLGRDDRFGLVEGDWVEVVDDDYILQNRAAPLRQVTAIDRVRMTVTLSGKKDDTVGGTAAKHPHLRRWDQKAGDPGQGGLTLSATDNAALIFPQANSLLGRPANVNTTDTKRLSLTRQNTLWLDLEDGVQVQFTVPPDSAQPAPQFRTGDYWLIPARVATGDVEWPTETVPNPAAGQAATAPVPMPPDGVTHHYAPLALVSISGTAVEVQDDCGVAFWQDTGVLRFVQDGGPYSVDLAQEIEAAPTQASQPEMAVAQPKPAAAPATKRVAKAAAAPVAKAIQAARAAQPAAAQAAPAATEPDSK
jgi:hypothetical protein